MAIVRDALLNRLRVGDGVAYVRRQGSGFRIEERTVVQIDAANRLVMLDHERGRHRWAKPSNMVLYREEP